MIHEDNQLK